MTELGMVSTEVDTASTTLLDIRTQHLPAMDDRLMQFVASFNSYAIETEAEIAQLKIQVYLIGGVALAISILALVLP